ncbi:MAG: hypothetical protein EAZ55_00930 [Cytophagales bacterium]|nr:MAG: hypothetical protein EAZ55_00930 [Cytophagales bacterium]
MNRLYISFCLCLFVGIQVLNAQVVKIPKNLLGNWHIKYSSEGRDVYQVFSIGTKDIKVIVGEDDYHNVPFEEVEKGLFMNMEDYSEELTYTENAFNNVYKIKKQVSLSNDGNEGYLIFSYDDYAIYYGVLYYRFLDKDRVDFFCLTDAVSEQQAGAIQVSFLDNRDYFYKTFIRDKVYKQYSKLPVFSINDEVSFGRWWDLYVEAALKGGDKQLMLSGLPRYDYSNAKNLQNTFVQAGFNPYESSKAFFDYLYNKELSDEIRSRLAWRSGSKDFRKKVIDFIQSEAYWMVGTFDMSFWEMSFLKLHIKNEQLHLDIMQKHRDENAFGNLFDALQSEYDTLSYVLDIVDVVKGKDDESGWFVLGPLPDSVAQEAGGAFVVLSFEFLSSRDSILIGFGNAYERPELASRDLNVNVDMNSQMMMSASLYEKIIILPADMRLNEDNFKDNNHFELRNELLIAYHRKNVYEYRNKGILASDLLKQKLVSEGYNPYETYKRWLFLGYLSQKKEELDFEKEGLSIIDEELAANIDDSIFVRKTSVQKARSLSMIEQIELELELIRLLDKSVSRAEMGELYKSYEHFLEGNSLSNDLIALENIQYNVSALKYDLENRTDEMGYEYYYNYFHTDIELLMEDNLKKLAEIDQKLSAFLANQLPSTLSNYIYLLRRDIKNYYENELPKELDNYRKEIELLKEDK